MNLKIVKMKLFSFQRINSSSVFAFIENLTDRKINKIKNRKDNEFRLK
jgi:hypothetical protein